MKIGNCSIYDLPYICFADQISKIELGRISRWYYEKPFVFKGD